jgi:hypothetical protein
MREKVNRLQGILLCQMVSPPEEGFVLLVQQFACCATVCGSWLGRMDGYGFYF